MRRYDDPVEVRVGEASDSPSGSTLVDERAPAQFLWHGRLWKVRSVLAHWVETSPWWTSPGVQAVIGAHESDEDRPVPRPVGDLLTERELWRVEAGVFTLWAGFSATDLRCTTTLDRAAAELGR